MLNVGRDDNHPLLQLDIEKIHWLSPIGAILDELNSGEKRLDGERERGEVLRERSGRNDGEEGIAR